MASGGNCLLGLALAVNACLDMRHAASLGAGRNGLLIGAVIVVCSTLRVSKPHATVYLSGANIAFGIWLMFAPWNYDFTANTERAWLSILTGIAVSSLALVSGRATLKAEDVV